MRETRADTALALTAALLLHALLALLVAFGLWWTRPPVSAAGQPVSADLVDASALSPAAQRALSRPQEQPPEEAAPPPQPLPAPVPEDAQVAPQPQAQERIPEPDTREQERVDRNAESPETAAREQEEKRRQAQIDLTERQRQEEAEQKRRLAQQQLADIRKLRAQAAREAQLHEAKLKQLADYRARNAAEAAAQADARASAPPGNNGVNNELLARYQAAIQEAIRAQWIKPDNVPDGAHCRLIIRQLRGGDVMEGGVSFGTPCQFDAAARDSIERAVLKAAPLPYAGFEPVFNRILNINFTAQSQ